MNGRPKVNVPINVPYLVELVEKSGMNRKQVSEKLMRGSQFISELVTKGRASKRNVKYIAQLLDGDEKKLLKAVPYDPEDYRVNVMKYKPQQPQKDGTIADYIALISDSLIELAKNQGQVSELLTLTSKQSIANAHHFAELRKQLEEMSQKVDEIHRELK
jgi:hypothetical protein